MPLGQRGLGGAPLLGGLPCPSKTALGAYLASRQAARDENLDISETRKHFEDELSVYAPTILRMRAAALQKIPSLWRDEVEDG